MKPLFHFLTACLLFSHYSALYGALITTHEECNATLESRQNGKVLIIKPQIGSRINVCGLTLEKGQFVGLRPSAIFFILPVCPEGIQLSYLLEYVRRKDLPQKERDSLRKKDLEKGLTEEYLTLSDNVCRQTISTFFEDGLFDCDEESSITFSKIEEREVKENRSFYFFLKSFPD